MMFAGIVKAIIVVTAIIVGVAGFVDEWKRIRAEEREYDDFENNRARRQKECDLRALAVAKRELIDEWVQIHFAGEARHDRS